MKSSPRNIFHWAVSNVFRWTNLRAAFVGSMADRDRKEARDLYAKVTRAYNASRFADENGATEFVFRLVEEVSIRAGRVPGTALRDAQHEAVWRLLMEEPVVYGLPDRPDFDHLSIAQLQQWRSFLHVKQRVLGDPPFYLEVWREKIIRILEGQMHHFPDFVFAAADESEEPAPYRVSIVDVCAQPADAVERTMATFYDDDVTRAGLFDAVRQRLDDNLLRASGLTQADKHRARSLTTPSSARDTPRDIAATFLAGTPFADFFLADVPFRIPQKSRFEHMHILAGILTAT